MSAQSMEKSRFRRDYYTLYLYIMSVVCGIHQAIFSCPLASNFPHHSAVPPQAGLKNNEWINMYTIVPPILYS